MCVKANTYIISVKCNLKLQCNSLLNYSVSLIENVMDILLVNLDFSGTDLVCIFKDKINNKKM